MDYRHIQTPDDLEIICFMVETAIESIMKRYQYNKEQLVMSNGMAALLKRAGQIILIIRGRGNEIRSYEGPPTEPHYEI